MPSASLFAESFSPEAAFFDARAASDVAAAVQAAVTSAGRSIEAGRYADARIILERARDAAERVAMLFDHATLHVPMGLAGASLDFVSGKQHNRRVLRLAAELRARGLEGSIRRARRAALDGVDVRSGRRYAATLIVGMSVGRLRAVVGRRFGGHRAPFGEALSLPERRNWRFGAARVEEAVLTIRSAQVGKDEAGSTVRAPSRGVFRGKREKSSEVLILPSPQRESREQFRGAIWQLAQALAYFLAQEQITVFIGEAGNEEQWDVSPTGLPGPDALDQLLGASESPAEVEAALVPLLAAS